MEYNYISTGEYYSHGRGSTAHGMKAGNLKSIERAAKIMAKYVKPDMLLVPMANHVGYATYTKTLADEIAKLSGAQVLDVMKGVARETFYDKKARGEDVTKDELGLYLSAEVPKDKRILIIDNVVSKGTTAAAAIDLIPNAIMFAYADVGNADKIEGVRNITQEYVIDNNINVNMDNKLQWFETYLAAQEKLDFEKAEQAYKEIPAFRRLFTAAPKDPMPGMSAQDLAESYVREFKQAYYPEIKVNEPIHLNNGARITIDFEYQKENLQPVLSLTHDDNGMVYQERKAFEKDGTSKEWGIVYPLSEVGITGRLENFSSYKEADKKTVLETQKVFDNMIEGISNSLKENVAKEIDLVNIFVNQQSQQKENVEDIAKSFGFKKEFSNDTVILMNKEVSVDLDKYIKYELAINTKTNKFELGEYHKESMDDNPNHDLTKQYHQHFGETSQLAEKLGQVLGGQVQQQNIEQPYAYVGIIHSLDNSTPSVAYTTEHEYLAALEHALKTNPQNLSYETRSENPQLHKQVEDLLSKAMEAPKQETVQQSSTKDFNYETASIIPQQQLISDLQQKFKLQPETIKEFAIFMEAAHPTDKSYKDQSADMVVFPYVKMDGNYNLSGHSQSTMSAVDFSENRTDSTNHIIGYEHYGKGQNIPFSEKLNETTLNGGVWMATKAANPESVNNVILFNSAVDAMSFYEKNKESINLKDTALISVGSLAREKQIEGVAERFPLAYMQTAFNNTILGKLSEIAVIATASGEKVNFEVADNNNINFTTKTQKFTLPVSEINLDNFKEKAHISDTSLHANLDLGNIKVHHPQGKTFNADLIQSKQVNQEQEHHRQMKL